MKRDVSKVLEYLTRRGAVTCWEAGPHNRFVLTTADGKVHHWSGGQVLSFWAGVFAGINLERKRNGRAPCKEAQGVPDLPRA